MIKHILPALRCAVALLCIWSLAVLPISVPVLQAQTTPPRSRVAVLDFEGVGVSEAEAAAVTDQLRSDLVRLRAFVVLDRGQTETVLREMALQQSGVTTPDKAAQIGKLLNVEFIVTGRITSLGDAYQVNAQMISVETAEIERSESILYQGHILGLLQENIGTMAARLAEVEEPPPAEALVSEQPQQQKEGEDEGGMPWWAWALIGVGVLGVAAAAGGGGDGGGSQGGTAPACTSPSGCGSVGVVW